MVTPVTKGPSSLERRNKMRAGNLVSNSLLDYWFGKAVGWIELVINQEVLAISCPLSNLP